MSNVSRLPDCYRKDPVGNNFKFLEINQQATKELKEDIQVIQEVLNLNSACGKSLDLYGGALGRQRGSMTDSQYRYALYAQIGRNNVTGDYESIIGALVMMFGLEMGQITPKDFELTEDRERCLVRLKKYPEVLEEAGFEIREIYQMIKYLLPVCVLLLIQFYYWYNILIRYDNTLRIFTEFYPRYNLAYHHWEGDHVLDGGKYLNGYDADTLVDFYPVVQAISMDVLPDAAVETIICSTADVCSNVAMDAESTVMVEAMADSELSTGIWVTGKAEALPDEAAHITMGQAIVIKIGNGGITGVQVDIPGAVSIGVHQLQHSVVNACYDGGADMGFKAVIGNYGATECNCVYYRAEASVVPKAFGSGKTSGSYLVGVGYQNGLVVEKNLRYLEGLRTLSGTGLLNAEIFNYIL